MTREQFAKKIRWGYVMWFAGILNVVAMMPQLIGIWSTRKVEGISLSMFGMFMFIQIAFGVQGFFSRSRAQMVSMGVSACISLAIIVSVLYLRSVVG